jgi:hypothetical protein
LAEIEIRKIDTCLHLNLFTTFLRGKWQRRLPFEVLNGDTRGRISGKTEDIFAIAAN